jgi:hypothetical protein
MSTEAPVSAIDYAFQKPTTAELLAKGVTDVFRYVGPPEWGKTITQAEFNELIAAGIHVWLVFERGADDSSGGEVGGRANASLALQCVPDGYEGPIWFACDEGLEGAALVTAISYIRGASAVMGGPTRTGAYGEGALLQITKDQGLTNYLWQSASTSFPGNATTLPITQVQQGLDGPLPGTDADTIVLPLIATPAPPPVPTRQEATVPVSAVIKSKSNQEDVFQVSGGCLWHKWLVAGHWGNECIAGPAGGVSKVADTFPNQQPQVALVDSQCVVTIENAAGSVYYFAQGVTSAGWGANKLS